MIKNIFRLIYLNYKKFSLSGVGYAKYLGVSIGNDCRVLTSSFGSEPWLIEVGNKVTITSGVKILTHDGATWLIQDENGRRYSYKKTVIGNNVFIGVNAILMPGLIVEDNVIIAAGSVVTKSIASGSIVGGNPARIIGDFFDYKDRLLKLGKSDLDMDSSLDYRNRIEKIVDPDFKSFLK